MHPRWPIYQPSGFPLVGARVDVIDTNPVSALVYNRRLHVINLFARPIATAYDTSIQQRTVKGYNVVSWREDGNEYSAISDLNAAGTKVVYGVISHGIWTG